MTWHAYAYLILGALIVAVELIAARNKQSGDTISEYVWKVIKLKEQPKKWTAARVVLLAALLWLTTHLVWGTDDGLAWVLVGA